MVTLNMRQAVWFVADVVECPNEHWRKWSGAYWKYASLAALGKHPSVGSSASRFETTAEAFVR